MNFTLPDSVRVYAVGDIHGQAALLEKALNFINDDARDFDGERIIEIFLGDYIDRGMHSRQVLDLLLESPAEGHERICLRGNHEETLLQFLDAPEIIRKWVQFGGFTTFSSYDVAIPKTLSGDGLIELHEAFLRALPHEHLTFIKNLELSYSIGGYFFVHAGVRPRIPLEKQQEKDMLWIRDKFLNHGSFYEKYIVHGHSPVAEMDIRDNRANIDLSKAEDGRLGCLKLENDKRHDCTIFST